MKDKTNMNLIIRSILVFALTMAIRFPIQALSAEPADGNMMNHTDGGNMMNHAYGWTWLWTVIGVLVVVLLFVLIIKLSKK